MLFRSSASPARLTTLRNAGLDPEVVVSGVDEEQVVGLAPAALAQRLAEMKCDAVAPSIDAGVPVLGCDSVLELDGEALGKPGVPEVARERWRAMRGRTGVLHTGHCLRIAGTEQVATATASTVVHFADLDDAEIDAYVATGEPLQVAGAFTLDSLGGAFVTGIEGDPHNVVGVSLPLLRDLCAAVGVRWTDLWVR